MSTETKSALATAFAVMAVIAALASATVSGITAITISNQIQNQRFDASRTNCLDVNQRHDNAITTLNAVVTQAQQKATPKRAAQIKQSVAASTLLIDALVPKRPDCVAYANSIVRP